MFFISLSFISIPPPTHNGTYVHGSDIPQDLCPLYRPGEWVELPSEQDLNPFSRYEALSPPRRPIILDDIGTSEVVGCHPADESPSDEGFTELELLQNLSGIEKGSPETSHSRPETADTACLSLEVASLPDSEKSKTSTDQTVDVVGLKYGEQEEQDEKCHNGATDGDVDTVLGMDKLRSIHLREESSVKEYTVTSHELTDAEVLAKVEIVSTNASKIEAKIQRQPGIKSSDNFTTDNEKSSKPSNQVDTKSQDITTLGEGILREEDEQTSETEMKSWLLKRMQGPIEGKQLCENDYDI